MDDYVLLWRIVLGPHHLSTGRTIHYVGGEVAPLPAELRIVRYNEDPGYYLLYCDGIGKEITDTYHESPNEAKEQALWEFNVGIEEWKSS